MSRANITINFTYANVTSGRITATPKASFIDSTGKLVVGGISFPSVAIASGAATIVLPETELEGIAYRFAVESGVSPNFTLIQTFDAIVKNVTPQNGNTFLTQFFSPDSLDTSIYNIADLLSKTPFLDRLATRIPGFNFKVYTTTTVFAKNDFTFRGDRYYQWIKSTTGTNVDPLTSGNYTDPGGLRDGVINVNASWLVTSNSLLGSGMATTPVVYDNASFVPLATEPASRKNLTELEALLRSSLGQPNLTDYAKLSTVNNFTGTQNLGAGGTVPDLPGSDNSSAIANSKTVRAIVAAIGIGNLINKVSVLLERNNQGVSSSLIAGINSRNLNTIARNPNADIVSIANRQFVLKAGTYLAFCGAIANRCNGNQLYLYNNSANGGAGGAISTSGLSSFAGSYLTDSAAQNVEISYIDVFTLTVNSTLSLRHNVETGGADVGGVAANRPGVLETFARVVLFRLD